VGQPQQPQYPQQSPALAGPPALYGPPPQKKRRVWPWVLGGILLLGIMACGGCAVFVGGVASEVDKEANNVHSSSGPKGDNTSTAVNVGEPARDGKFEFTVTKVQSGVTSVGGEFGQKAQGQFVLVSVTVKNIGDEAQMLDDSNQVAYDAEGRKYEADGAAGIFVNENSETFLNDINPGNEVKGTIVFDVPKGTKLTKLELHDSAFSGGVVVNL
jgi:hypothetical protein